MLGRVLEMPTASRWVLLLLTVLLDPARGWAVLPEHRQLAWHSDDPNRGPSNGQPEQLHLSYGGRPQRMLLTWLTHEDVGESEVRFRTGTADWRRARANVTLFRDGLIPRDRFIHRAELLQLEPGKEYGIIIFYIAFSGLTSFSESKTAQCRS